MANVHLAGVERVAAIAMAALAFTAPGSAPAQAPAQPTYVGRIVGVYDDRSGSPLDSVEIRDMITGSFAYTTSTGTLSLFFVDTAGSLLRIRKFGYTPITMFVGNAEGLPPLTITLEPLAQKLPAVVTRDTVRRYIGPMLRGFEQRRKTGMRYFIPETQLRKEENRPLANAALQQGYVDLSQFLVSDLGGVEFHNVGDMPAEFAHTGGCGGALYLWTREK